MISTIAKKRFPLPPDISKPEIREGHSYDAQLAEDFPDLRCQLEHASPVRRKHDEKARDSVNWLPLSELPDRLKTVTKRALPFDGYLITPTKTSYAMLTSVLP